MSGKRLYGIRGATGVVNTAESVMKETGNMCRMLFSKNALRPDDIVSIQFSVTGDVSAMNPASALRHVDCGIDISSCALFCGVEPGVSGGLPHMIRILVTAYMPDGSVPCHIYMNGAEVLRPDFATVN